VYFESEEGRGGYFRPDGSSVQRQFLMAPLRYSRISSRFSAARRHPILKITRPHHGIDYVAKAGAPAWSVADGEVIYRGWAGGFGNLLKVRHVKGYVSYYAHLSRFATGLRVGDRVQQKQVIGYVGQTGLATGPHVCFRVAQNGRYVNPANLEIPVAKPVSDAVRDAFVATRDTLLSELDAGTFVASGEAL
jgi:murein DD-endopeptidase MepM/ murein hydrolase activator NlpD